MRALALLVTALVLAGCVERELVIESDPDGVEVFVDGTLAGVTSGGAPVKVPFDFYGTRQVVARRAGYRPFRRNVELCVPWWQVFPLGLFSDVLWPGTIRDEHRVRVRLERRPPPPPAEEEVERAEALGRQEGLRPPRE
ncbi:MAG: PEGA domain-containing protein [Planctomycetota bacterium]